jgi:hypothetical protein
MSVEDAVTSPLLADNLHMKLLYLENRGEGHTILDKMVLIGFPLKNCSKLGGPQWEQIQATL